MSRKEHAQKLFDAARLAATPSPAIPEAGLAEALVTRIERDARDRLVAEGWLDPRKGRITAIPELGVVALVEDADSPEEDRAAPRLAAEWEHDPDDGHKHWFACLRCGVDNGLNEATLDAARSTPTVDVELRAQLRETGLAYHVFNGRCPTDWPSCTDSICVNTRRLAIPADEEKPARVLLGYLERRSLAFSRWLDRHFTVDERREW